MRVFSKSFSIFLVSAVLTGCASINNFQKLNDEPKDASSFSSSLIPEQWTVPAPIDLPTIYWVDSFSDPILKSLVGQAFVSNPSMLAAQYRVDAASARVDISQSNLFLYS